MKIDIIGKEFIFTNKLYNIWVFVFWIDVKPKIILSESQYKESMRGFRLDKNESIKIKILKKQEPICDFYLCELLFPQCDKVETLWVTKEIISIWLESNPK